MEAAEVSNDTRGWIMCIVSGIACSVGACVICVDLIVRKLPGKKSFNIQDNSPFLACSLSLSFGVMIFSALFSMLPESKEYLGKDGWDKSSAGLIMMGCFVAGFLGIQVISRLLHQFMPSHVVDCDHSHDHDEAHEDHKHPHSVSRQSSRIGRPKLRAPSSVRRTTTVAEVPTHTTEITPLLAPQSNGRPLIDPRQNGRSALTDSLQTPTLIAARRPSMMEVRNRVISFVKDTKLTCDEGGPCYGYTDPCGQECFKHLSSRASLARKASSGALRPRPSFAISGPLFGPVPEANSESGSGNNSPRSPAAGRDSTDADHTHGESEHHGPHDHSYGHHHHQAEDYDCEQMSEASTDLEAQDGPHHHHVPTNAFLAIGLQTVIAIALHKFPEGFITYATNHANPQLGFNVFMALFVHNIAEGFSMALPLYMALGSRLKAIAWSTLLGGFSQPAGAAIAWLVFKMVGQTSDDPANSIGIDNTAYAVLFAVTSGIMTSVALQLFVESLSLNHNRNLSIAFAFLGMVLLGVSGAIAGH